MLGALSARPFTPTLQALLLDARPPFLQCARTINPIGKAGWLFGLIVDLSLRSWNDSHLISIAVNIFWILEQVEPVG